MALADQFAELDRLRATYGDVLLKAGLELRGLAGGPLRKNPAPLPAEGRASLERAMRAMGVLDLMHLTWFCHTPVRQKPCGRCPPCIQAIEEGMRDRVSLRALGRYYGRPLERVSHLGRRVARALAHPRASIDRIRGKGR